VHGIEIHHLQDIGRKHGIILKLNLLLTILLNIEFNLIRMLLNVRKIEQIQKFYLITLLLLFKNVILKVMLLRKKCPVSLLLIQQPNDLLKLNKIC